MKENPKQPRAFGGQAGKILPGRDKKKKNFANTGRENNIIKTGKTRNNSFLCIRTTHFPVKFVKQTIFSDSFSIIQNVSPNTPSHIYIAEVGFYFYNSFLYLNNFAEAIQF